MVDETFMSRVSDVSAHPNMHARIAFSTLDSDIVSGSGPNTFELWALKSRSQWARHPGVIKDSLT